jgi:hypothetical protein
LLGNEFTTFKKGPFATNTTDAYKRLGAHFHYDDADRLECVDLVEPASASCCGVSLLDTPIEKALQNLADAGLPSRYDDGYFIDACGIVLSAPDGTVNAVTVCRKGYYND